MKRNFYFDMDGVLAVYEREAYIGSFEKNAFEKEKPTFLQKNKHYFLNCKPDMKMLHVIDILWSAIRTGHYGLDPESQIFIVTSIANHGTIFNEQFHDKIAWIGKWIPYFPIENLYVSVTEKREIGEMINNRLISFNDILIDDYNKNLQNWSAAGGRALKYCNGINDPSSWTSELNLTEDMTAYDIVQKLIT